MESKYWAFISYSHADKKWGEWLHRALETYKVPKPLVGVITHRNETVPSRVFPIFRDRDELPTSSDLGAVISRALKQSRYLIVICSPRATASRWVSQEILDFKKLGREDRILALIVDGEPNAAERGPSFAAEAESFPDALKYPLSDDGNLDKSRRTEPIAADAREGGDGRENAKLKLLAGILAVNYDDLKRRDEQRRRQRQRTLVSISAALVLIFASLSIVALWQWRQANNQRAIAETRKVEADNQRAIAEENERLAKEERARIEAQTAADEEELGRKALLVGDDLEAVQHLSLAYEIQSRNPAVRLMLRAAMYGLEGLTTLVRSDSGTISRLEVARDGGRILTVAEGAVRVWNPADGSLIATLGKSGEAFNDILAASFTPDGKRVLFANEAEAFIHDLANGQKHQLLGSNPDEAVGGALLSSDGRMVTVSSRSYKNGTFTTHLTTFNSSDASQQSKAEIPDLYALVSLIGTGSRAVLVGGPTNPDVLTAKRKALVVELQTGKVVRELLIGPSDEVLPNPQGNLIEVSHPADAPPQIYSIEIGSQVAELSATGVRPIRAVWTASGQYLLSRERTSSTLWDASTWKPIHTWSDVAWTAETVNQSESLLATVDEPSEITIWDLHSGQLLKRIHDRTCAGESQLQFTIANPLRFSPDSRYLIFGGVGTCITIWDWRRVHPVQPVLSGHDGTVNSIAFDHNGKRVVTAGADNNAIVWNIGSGAIEFKLKVQGGGSASDMSSAEFSQDDSKILTGGRFQKAKLWRASDGKLLRQLDFDTHAVVIGDIVRVAPSDQGNRLVTFSSNGWGALWDLQTQQQIKSIGIAGGGSVQAVSFARDGSGFVVADNKGLAHVFDSPRGELKRSVGRNGVPLRTAEIGPRNDSVLTAADSGQITIWSTADGHAVQSMNSNLDAPRLNDVHFSPDGEKIIAACADNKVRVWNARNGQTLLVVAEESLPGEVELGAPLDLTPGKSILPGMLWVRYSPDESFITAAGQSGRLLVWDAKTGRQLRRIEGHTGRITSLIFSPDGSRLGSSSEDKTARIWDMGLETRSPTEIAQEIAKFRQPPSRR